MLNLDETIIHCEELAEELEKRSSIHCDSMEDTMEAEKCRVRAAYHRQLAEWLKALKEIWDSGDCNNCRIRGCHYRPKTGHLVRYNCPFYRKKEVIADDN